MGLRRHNQVYCSSSRKVQRGKSVDLQVERGKGKGGKECEGQSSLLPRVDDTSSALEQHTERFKNPRYDIINICRRLRMITYRHAFGTCTCAAGVSERYMTTGIDNLSSRGSNIIL
jgi:hypothetical protein